MFSVFRLRRQTDQVCVVILAVLGRGQHVLGDVKFCPFQRLGGSAIGNAVLSSNDQALGMGGDIDPVRLVSIVGRDRSIGGDIIRIGGKALDPNFALKPPDAGNGADTDTILL